MNKDIETIKKMDALMTTLEKNIEEIRLMKKRLKEIANTETLLEEYYETKWLDDHERYPDEQYGILSEDGLFNVFHDVLEARKELLKYLVLKL